MAKRPILLVEDDPADRGLALMALERNQIPNPVVVAEDGSEALDFLFGTGKYEGRRQTPALVLLDLKLPVVGGLEVLKRMREDSITELVPVVVLSSSKEHMDIISSYRLGANSYVQKPVKFEDFLIAVQQLGQYWLGLNESASLNGAS